MSHDIANRGEILLYSDENGREFVNVIFKDETFWLPGQFQESDSIPPVGD